MGGAFGDRGTLRRIATTLLALSLLAERAAGRSFPVRFLVLAVLSRAEAVARTFVARSMATLITEAIEAGCPDLPFPDLACLDEPFSLHYGAADAELLALRLRILAAVLGMLSDGDDICDDQSAGFSDDRSGAYSTIWSARADAPNLPLLLLVRLPAARRPLRPHDTS